MRPLVPDAFQDRSRKSSTADQPVASSLAGPRNAAPSTFFLARVEDDDDANDTNHGHDMEESQSSTFNGPGDSSYGVQSLESAAEEATVDTRDEEVRVPADKEQRLHEDASLLDRRRSTIKAADIQGDNPSDAVTPASNPHNQVHHPSPNPNNVVSLPMTPLTLGSPAEPSSLPSSPKSTSTRSLKPFDEISNQDETEGEPLDFGGSTERFDTSQLQDSAPQLVMPCIKMPSRRPFTERGKNMGRFKILVAGAAGSGKTSLVKSMVQICEDIVHVDPPPPDTHSEASEHRKTHIKHSPRHSKGPVPIAETYASTKPYPSWWSDLEDSRVLRRRKSMGDVVLERNLCFVDAPGARMSRTDQTDSIIQYINQQFHRTLNAVNTVSTDLQGLLGGNGGSQVDAVLYLISEATLAVDIECIRKLSSLSNVIPVISKTDLLSQAEMQSLKKAFHSKAEEADVRPFLFRDSVTDAQDGPSSPFAVSSALSSDDENMDASILMSPDYVQPLMPSELEILVEKMFDRDNLSWLRHSAAKKLIQKHEVQQDPLLNTNPPGRRGSAISHFSPYVGLSSAPSISDSQVLVSRPGSSPGYSLARVTDHTQREERLAQVRLARWASDLQQSLQNERERYEVLARGERAVWLTERLSECVVDGTLVPLNRTPGFSGFQGAGPDPEESGGRGELFTRNGKSQRVRYRVTDLSPHDPLGLLLWDEDLKRRGWILVQVVGGFGVVGGLALWLGKCWGLTSHGMFEWNLGRLSGGYY